MARFTKKKIVVLTVALVALGAGGAFAYWTAGGSGTGSATTGTNVAITAVQTSTVTAMGPGVAPQALSGNFNNANAGSVYVATVTAAIGTITGGGATCEATDYTLANPVMTVNAQVPAGTAQGAWTGATLSFNNKGGENQDDCKNATVEILYTIG